MTIENPKPGEIFKTRMPLFFFRGLSLDYADGISFEGATKIVYLEDNDPIHKVLIYGKIYYLALGALSFLFILRKYKRNAITIC